MKKKAVNRITVMTIIFSLILSLYSNLAFASNGTIFSENHKPDSPKIVSLMLSAYNTTYVEQGEKKSIQLKALYSDGSVKNVTKSATWNSRDTSIVKVSEGEIKGISPGDVALNVKYSTFPEINFFVSVKEKVMEEKGLVLSAGQLRLEPTDKPVQVKAYTKSNFDSKEVTSIGKWSTSNSNVAVVNSSGQITPVGVGEAYISFRYEKMVDKILVNVVKAKNLVTDTPMLEILPNESVGAVLNEVFNDGNSKDVTNEAKWTVEDTSLATVTEQGVVNAKGKIGKTKLIATYRTEIHSPVEIEVIITNKLTNPRVIGLTASSSYYFLGLGDEYGKEVSIKAVFSDGSIKDVTDSIEWISSNPFPITSVELNKIYGLTKGTTVLTAIYGGKMVQIPVTVSDKYGPAKPPIAKSMSVTPNVTNMMVNEQKQLKVEVTYTDGNVMDDTPYALYKTDNPSVVSINQDGLLTAVGTGTAIIIVYSAGYTERFTIIVTETPSKDGLNRIVDLKPNESHIEFAFNEGTHPYTIKAEYQDGMNADVTLKGRSTSLNPDIVTVENGVLTAMAPGTTQVLINHGSNFEILDVTILPESPTPEQDLKIESLLFNTFDVVVQKDKIFPLRISAQYNDGAQREITKNVQWTSKNPSIAVIEEGKITGKTNGSTTIIGKIDGFPTFEIPVTVNEKGGSVNLVGIDLSEGMLMMQPGDEPVDAIAFAEYTDNNVIEVDTEGTWESTDESVATVDKNGKITPVGPGEAYVYFRYHEGLNDAVWVRNIKPHSLEPSITDVVLEPNESLIMSLFAVYGPRDVYDVADNAEWSVADKTIATITDAGRIVAQSVGKTTITASYMGITKEINVEVVEKHATQVLGIFAAPDYIVSSAGKKTKIMIHAIYSDGTIKDITSEATYRLSNPDIANTTPDNQIITGSDGAAIVMAEYEGFNTIIPVVVNQ
ncbi:Ig-like domain-containing protein [Neobacillus drentensis]|uniref:Ig-like domain-containing protein n=1 Tax=Neobacillus drentensis TaxID=220684 RepID=UPI002FFD6416